MKSHDSDLITLFDIDAVASSLFCFRRFLGDVRLKRILKQAFLISLFDPLNLNPRRSFRVGGVSCFKPSTKFPAAEVKYPCN